MAKRQRFHLVYDQDQWKLKREKSERSIKNFNTKEEAKDFGTDFVKQNEPSQLIIHKKDGKIQEERTYGGKDPYPPKG